MMKWILILALASVAFASDCQSDCPSKEEFSDCRKCEKTCNIWNPDQHCEQDPGCRCKNGFMRNSKGVCVKNDKCDPPCHGDLGREFDPNGNTCPRTCLNHMNNHKCKRGNVGGACRCIDDLVEHHGECIHPRNCDKVCGDNEAFSECRANDCQNTCEDPTKSLTSPNQKCENGCVCRHGSVRDHKNVCIPLNLCGVECDGNLSMYEERCATRCSTKECCELEDEAYGCNATGQCSNVVKCACKPGYYVYEGNCIPRRECPWCDEKNEAWLRRRRDLQCSKIEPDDMRDCGGENCDCKEGCYCKLGYARNCDGKCIALADCGQSSCDGDPNAHYAQCDIDCEGTCEHKNGKPCIRGVCVKMGKCICNKGYVRNSKGKCVPPGSCDYCHRSNLPSNEPEEEKPSSCSNENNDSKEWFDPRPLKKIPKDQTCEMYLQGIQQVIESGFDKPGRRCLAGYVRNEKGKCVIPNDCCKNFPNTEFVTGPVHKGGTCEHPSSIECDWQPFGCRCVKGYLKISETNPTCVRACDCCKYI